MYNKLIQKVKKTVERYHMLELGDRVVVAVSGGPDSMVLLSVLNRLKFELSLNICIAHLDHNVRRGSKHDMQFVKKFAESLAIPFYSSVINRKNIKKHVSLEEYLRKLRYDFLFEVSAKFNANKIAVGHTKDDQAETVLMRFLRGSGLYGLSAILPCRCMGAFEIIRPLIEVSRCEIMNYLKVNKIKYRTDATNLQDRFLRNKVRIHLLPLLERQYNPSIKDTLSGVASTVGADYDYIYRQARQFLSSNLKYTQGGCSIRLDKLKKLDIALRRIVLRLAIESIQGDLRRFSFKHMQELEDLVFLKPSRSEVHLPFGLAILKTTNRLNIIKR